MIKTRVIDLKVGDYIHNETRQLTGLVDRVDPKSGYQHIFIKNISSLSYSWCFYHDESVFLLEEDEIEKFKARQKEISKFKNVRSLPRPYYPMGSDPEIFVLNKEGEVIPSYEFLKSKTENDKTIQVDKSFMLGGTGATTQQSIFWDGFQGEFNVQANECLGWVADSVFLGLKSMHQKAKAYNPDAKLTIQSTLDIDPMVLQEAKPEHVEFGCMPSFNIYGMSGLKKDGREVPFRSAGGHIHFGFGGQKKETIERYVKTLDKILAVACVSLFAKYDKAARREMYGLAGEYRLPAHGLEYRTLSNAWLCHPLIFNLTFELARQCTQLVNNDLENLWEATEEETIKCINECDVDLAREILARNKMMFSSIFAARFGEHKEENIYKIYMLGIDSIIDNPEDIENNWDLNGQYSAHCGKSGNTISTIESNKKYKLLKDEKVTEIYEELVKEIGKDIEIEEAAVPKRKQA